MPLDAILLTALRRELENSLLGAKIDRISMPEKDVLILSVHSREQGSRRVLLSVRPGSARISFTEQTMENPAQPPMFCMLLRKYLTGGRIEAIEQPLIRRLHPVGTCKKPGALLPLRPEKRRLFLPRGQTIK